MTAAPHDELVCGLDCQADCDSCLAARRDLDELRNPYRAADAAWEQLARLCPELRAAERPVLLTPGQLTPEQLGRLIYTLLQPQYREVLAELLLDLLAGRLGQVLASVREESR